MHDHLIVKLVWYSFVIILIYYVLSQTFISPIPKINFEKLVVLGGFIIRRVSHNYFAINTVHIIVHVFYKPDGEQVMPKPAACLIKIRILFYNSTCMFHYVHIMVIAE